LTGTEETADQVNGAETAEIVEADAVVKELIEIEPPKDLSPEGSQETGDDLEKPQPDMPQEAAGDAKLQSPKSS
jgi:hypothetical protein